MLQLFLSDVVANIDSLVFSDMFSPFLSLSCRNLYVVFSLMKLISPGANNIPL